MTYSGIPSEVIFDIFATLIANYDRNHYLEMINDMGVATGTDDAEFLTV